MMYGMYYALSIDACRRFVYGLSLEKNTMSIWHASRSAIVKCTFDFNLVSAASYFSSRLSTQKHFSFSPEARVDCPNVCGFRVRKPFLSRLGRDSERLRSRQQSSLESLRQHVIALTDCALRFRVAHSELSSPAIS